MATDIAFSLGVLSLLGRRVPFALKVFLTALAIADDPGAVLVIGLFYTNTISVTALLVAGGFVASLVVLNSCRVGQPVAYLLPSLGLWGAMLHSGVHATLAGVLVAMCIPARSPTPRARSAHEAETAGSTEVNANGFARPSDLGGEAGREDWQATTSHADAESLMLRLERLLHPWVSFGVMPLFALANAGVTIRGDPLAMLLQPAGLGILAGLVLGKPLGIGVLAWMAVRVGIAALPAGVTWRHIAGVGMLGGIGFTMSLFIANLAFGQGAFLDAGKVAILSASLLAGLAGAISLLMASRTAKPRARSLFHHHALGESSTGAKALPQAARRCSLGQ
jgi:NhaA family Na+:H+ antiporter